MALEFIRMAIVYLHLIACCVAIGLVLTNDIVMVKQLVNAGGKHQIDRPRLIELEKTVAWALLALWISGIAIVSFDASLKGWDYFANPKLQSKIGIVVLLTLNGLALNRVVLPLMLKTGSLLRMSSNQRMLAIFCGAVSGVSWFYAAMLGIGRPLNWKYSLVEILAAYPLMIGGAFLAMVSLTAWAQSRYKASRDSLAFKGTRQRPGPRFQYRPAEAAA
jgi:hypothetical protein